MHILFVTPEVSPYSQSGELGESSGALCRAVRERGVQVTVVSPMYGSIDPEQFSLARRLSKLTLRVGSATDEAVQFQGQFPQSDVSITLIDHPASFAQSGLRGDDSGGYGDNPLRFARLCAGAVAAMNDAGTPVDIVQLIDWPAAILALWLRDQPRTAALSQSRVLFDLKDVSEKGLFAPSELAALGIGGQHFTSDGIEFHGQASLLKAGVVYADAVMAPSLEYAREIQTAPHGGGLHGLFAAIAGKLHAAVPGIDTQVWNPRDDHRLPQAFGPGDISAKAECKRALQTELGLPVRLDVPLFVLRADLHQPEELALAVDGVRDAASTELQVAFVGASAGGGLADRLASLGAEHGGNVVLRAGRVDAPAMHRLLGGADFLLACARHDPGGLQQLKALRYGAIPVVHQRGGLAETVVDFDRASQTGTGVCFATFGAESLSTAIFRARTIFKDRVAWTALRENAMRQDVSIERTAERYLAVYEELLRDRP